MSRLALELGQGDLVVGGASQAGVGVAGGLLGDGAEFREAGVDFGGKVLGALRGGDQFSGHRGDARCGCCRRPARSPQAGFRGGWSA